VEKALQAAGARFHYRFDRLNAFVVTVPENALQGLRQNPNVVDIEDDVPRYLFAQPAQAAPAVLQQTTSQTVPYGIDTLRH